MKSIESQLDIASLESLLKSKIEIFDKALKNMCLDELRILFHELKVLKEKVDEYNTSGRQMHFTGIPK